MTVLVESANGMIATPGGEVVATRCPGNPLDRAWSFPPDDGVAQTGVAWSGTLGESLFAADPRNWIGAGWTALEERCAALARDPAAGGRRVLWQPHARHVLSDVPSCLRFLAAHTDAPFGLALAPASLLEPSMLAAVEDHLERILVALGSRCELLILADVAVEEAGERCAPVPLGRGRLPRDAVRRLLGRCVPPSTPIVLGGGELETQLAWLDRLPARAAAPYTGTTPPGPAPALIAHPGAPMSQPVLDHPTLARVKSAFPEVSLQATEFRRQTTLVVPAEHAHAILRFLRDDPECEYDFLSDVTAVDYLGYPAPTLGRFAVVYLLASGPHGRRLTVKTFLDPTLDTSGIEADPALELASVTDIWAGAEWREREIYDMFGIRFRNHPDLRRILTWKDFPAHPLRKDYPLRGRGERETYQVLDRDSR